MVSVIMMVVVVAALEGLGFSPDTLSLCLGGRGKVVVVVVVVVEYGSHDDNDDDDKTDRGRSEVEPATHNKAVKGKDNDVMAWWWVVTVVSVLPVLLVFLVAVGVGVVMEWWESCKRFPLSLLWYSLSLE